MKHRANGIAPARTYSGTATRVGGHKLLSLSPPSGAGRRILRSPRDRLRDGGRMTAFGRECDFPEFAESGPRQCEALDVNDGFLA